MNIKTLDRDIENLTKIMIDTAAKHNNNYSHPEVVKRSQELDPLINIKQQEMKRKGAV